MLVGLPVQLFIQGLGIERARGGRNAGENQEGNQNGSDGRHDYFSKKKMKGNTIVASH